TTAAPAVEKAAPAKATHHKKHKATKQTTEQKAQAAKKAVKKAPAQKAQAAKKHHKTAKKSATAPAA
ncbi:acid-shock protein, partial [Yersinia enterocolitica]